jgi:hypothetical protein
VFIGYCLFQKGYKCLHIPTNKIIISRHVVFNEKTFPFQTTSVSGVASSLSGEMVMPLTSLFRQFAEPIPVPSSIAPLNSNSAAQFFNELADCSPDHFCAHSQSPDRSPTPLSSQLIPSDRSPACATDTSLSHDIFSSTDTSTVLISLHPMITRTRDNTRKPRQFPDHITYLSTAPEIEPLSFAQANTYSHWRQAMATEIDALARNETWTLVPPPSNQNIIGCKWAYKIKHNVNGSIARYKAHLVVKRVHSRRRR